MVFFRVFQHLVPDAQAWRLTIARKLRKFFEGLARTFDGTGDVYRTAVPQLDYVYAQLSPETTDNLEQWEREFGIDAALLDADRRLQLFAEWKATGGQSPGYIQAVLQAAGFDVYVHDCFSNSGPPYVVRDPRLYINQPLLGTYRCKPDTSPTQARCSGGAGRPRCNRFLNNETHYIVNKDLTRRAPPPVPDDPNTWPYFMYVGAATFGDLAFIDLTRRMQFERLLLKLRPVHLWIVLLVNYSAASGSHILTEGGSFITTESGDRLITE